MNSLARVTIASRVFCIAAILGLGLLSQDAQAIVTLIVIATIATSAVYVSLATPLATALVVTVEAGITGLVIGLALPGGVVFLPYLVVLTLIAGISRGVVGVSAVVIAQFCAIAMTALTLLEPANGEEIFKVLSPWLLTSIGAGLLGAWLRQAGKIPQPTDVAASYESARRLLSQLRTVARRLSSGLDPVTMSTQILQTVQDTLSVKLAGVFVVRTDGGLLAPLGYSDDAARDELSPNQAVTDECWAQMEPVVNVENGRLNHSHNAAFPLRVGSRMIGVVVAQLTATPSRQCLDTMMQELDEQSLRLDTALAFDEVRAMATTEERHRLAREIHDGIAQDVASLGYLVDDLLAASESDQQERDLTVLREELTRVVSELRLSIFDLRSEVLPEAGLGSALSDYVRQVGSRSKMTVHLTLDEAPTRLRAETEAELLRIAQEAITNARKHSGAENLWVDCTVHPPFAQLEVRDDGSGIGTGRADSYGLRIMKERAQRLDAQLEINHGSASRIGSGTIIRVTLGQERNNVTQGESEQVDDSARANHRSTG